MHKNNDGEDMTSEEYIKRSSILGWNFNLVVENPASDKIRKIHLLKQAEINDIVRKAKTDSNIKRVIVFGSAITNRCNPFIDVDICIDWNMPSHDEDGVFVKETLNLMKFISSRTKGNSDVLAYDDIENEQIKKAVDKGVVVYEYDV